MNRNPDIPTTNNLVVFSLWTAREGDLREIGIEGMLGREYGVFGPNRRKGAVA